MPPLMRVERAFPLKYIDFLTFPLQRRSWLIWQSCSAQISAATEESRPCLQRVCISFLPKRVCIAHLQTAVPADASTFTHGYDHVDLEMRLHFFWFLKPIKLYNVTVWCLLYISHPEHSVSSTRFSMTSFVLTPVVLRTGKA